MKNNSLISFYNNNDDENVYEIGIDEAGRGPLLGRVYSAAVILPRESISDFDFSKLKDSKKFHSEKKINEVAKYIEENAVSYGVGYSDEKTIDKYNILQSTQLAMHQAIKKTKLKINNSDSKYTLLVDGNYFRPTLSLNAQTNTIVNDEYYCIEGGDNKYCAIAAASILAKVHRDQYIKQLCEENPNLIDKYGIDKNKGYGTKQHMNGIAKYGRTDLHRQSFAFKVWG
jgi:ribonuclease HII